MNYFLKLFSLICIFLVSIAADGKNMILNNLLSEIQMALNAEALPESSQSREQQYFLRGYNGISLGVYQALQSIARNDELECVSRLLCEAASGGQPGFSGKQKLDKISLTKLISYLKLDVGSKSPLLVFGKAALLGVTNRGDPYSCIINYPKCPKDQNRLLYYLNNHKGGFFQYFDKPYEKSENYYHQHQYRPVYNYQNYQTNFKRNKIQFESSGGLYEKLKKKATTNVYATKYAHSALSFPRESYNRNKPMVFPKGVGCQKTTLRFNPEGLEFVKHVNESFYINCFHENSTDIWWYKDGEAISEALARIHVEKGNTFFSKGAALVFTSIQATDKGNYTCRSKVNNKIESLSFRLITYKPISFRDTPLVQSFGEFETGVIRCDAEGEPEPTISWFVNGKPAESNARYKTIGDGLLISNVSLEDAKQEFTCRAAAVNNITSNIELRNIKINVLHSPKLKGNAKSVIYGYTEGKINATCEVESNPPANFMWFRNNTRFFGEVNSTLFYEKNKSVLRISYVNTSVVGEYRCRATNERGSIDGVFLLKQIPKPEPPKKAKVHSTTHNSLQLDIHGPASRDHEVTSYKVQIMERREKETGKLWELAREVILPKGKPFIINDLKPNTEYVIRVTSQNGAGAGEFTHEIKTKTLSHTSGSPNFSFSNALKFFICITFLLSHS